MTDGQSVEGDASESWLGAEIARRRAHILGVWRLHLFEVAQRLAVVGDGIMKGVGASRAQGRVDAASIRGRIRGARVCLAMAWALILRIAPRLRPMRSACYAGVWRHDVPSHAGP